MSISTPFQRETHAEIAARIRGLTVRVDHLADHAGVLGAVTAQNVRAELDYLAGWVERADPGWASRQKKRHPMEGMGT